MSNKTIHPLWSKCKTKCPIINNYMSNTTIIVNGNPYIIKSPNEPYWKKINSYLNVHRAKRVTIPLKLNAFGSYAGAPNGYGSALKNNF